MSKRIYLINLFTRSKERGPLWSVDERKNSLKHDRIADILYLGTYEYIIMKFKTGRYWRSYNALSPKSVKNYGTYLAAFILYAYFPGIMQFVFVKFILCSCASIHLWLIHFLILFIDCENKIIEIESEKTRIYHLD